MKASHCAVIMLALCAAPAAAADGDEPERQQRWAELSHEAFGGRPIEAGEKIISIDAPYRSDDASLVPVTINISPGAAVTGTDLIIDENPSPIAAQVKFGPAGDPRQIKLRVRINGYTNMHAVARAADGKLLQTARFVKAAGGCSAPIGVSDDEAVRGMGEMRMKFDTNADLGAPEATLMIRHPNFNGMQMNLDTRSYTPARFITSIEVSKGGKAVLAMTSDISLSTNPVLSFLYKPGETGKFHVQVKDSGGGHWAQDFDAPPAAN